MTRVESCRAAGARGAAPARAWNRLAAITRRTLALIGRRKRAPIAWRKLAAMVLTAPLGLAAAASDRSGMVGPAGAAIARARLERTVVSVDAAPCNRARLLRTASGAVFETEAAPRLTPGSRIRVSGTVYPQASICKLYPWLRLDPDAPLPFGPPTALDVRLSRSIPGVLQQAAARAVASAESIGSGIADALATLPQIEIVAAPAALRSLLDTLRQWSQASPWWPWHSSRTWSRYWSRQQLRAVPDELAGAIANELASDLGQRQPLSATADSNGATGEDR